MNSTAGPAQHPSIPTPERPVLDERAEYRPRAKVERFMVPLLARAVTEAIGACAAASAKRSGRRCLDAGCGRQPFRALLESSGYGYDGLDTQQNADGTTRFIAPIDGPLPRELLEAGPFDLVLCTELLEHVADWESAFANIARLVSPGGRVIVTCPHFYILHEEPYDFWRPTPHSLRHFAQRHGLRVVLLEKLGTGWDVLGTQLAAFAPNPRPGSLPGLSHLAAGLTRLIRGLVYRLVLSGVLQSVVTDGGPLYLSNLVVLEKP